MQLDTPLPHLDKRRALCAGAEQRRRRMQRFDVAADRNRLGEDRAIVEDQRGYPLQGIDRGEGRRLVRERAEVDLLGRYCDALFSQKYPHPSWVWCPSPVEELHLIPPVNYNFYDALKVALKEFARV
jgi:hypothetical protein